MRLSVFAAIGSAVQRRVGDFYASGMDGAAVNAAGAGPLRFVFDRIAGLRTTADLVSELAGRPRPLIGGFTPEQRFFLSYASIWCGKARPEALRLRIKTDPHSPFEFRCNGPLSNLDEFARAFSVPEGAPMRRSAADRVTIW
jgi:predicted metalloendopeptidase